MQLVLIELGAGLEKQTRLQAAGDLSAPSGRMHAAVPQWEGLNGAVSRGPRVHTLACLHARVHAPAPRCVPPVLPLAGLGSLPSCSIAE